MIIDMKTRKSNVRPTFDIAPFAQTGESSQTDVVESSGGKMFLKTLRAFFRCFLGVKAEK